ncbi:ribose-phosphate diphosphokinase [Candidatus Pacearchaeota archaeon]|nr:MAG: ribose-phosphate diphosphokinase [Candidatus Pacearchaeota archaeon]
MSNFYVISFKEMRSLAKKVANELGAAYSEIEMRKFPDNELYVRVRIPLRTSRVAFIESFARKPNEKLISAFLVSSALENLGVKSKILVASYMPYMRQDKVFHRGESVSARKIVGLLARSFDRLYAIDPHLHRIPSLQHISKNAFEISANELVEDYIKRKFKSYVILAPDEESQQWGPRIASKLGMGYVLFKKTRFSDRKVKIVPKSFVLHSGSSESAGRSGELARARSRGLKEKLKLERVLVIDDIISTGKTMLETIQFAKKLGAREIVCIGIHGIFAEQADKRIVKSAQLITTNTIPSSYSKIDVSRLISTSLRKYF